MCPRRDAYFPVVSATPERSGGAAGTRLDWALETVLHMLRPHRRRRLSPRERRVESAATALFVVAAAALLVLVGSDRPFRPLVAGVLVVGYAAASRIRLHVGGGFTMPTQLVLVPMLLWLPAPSVPAMVGCALAIGALVDVLAGRAHAERVLSAPADAWYSLGAAGVFAAGGEPAAESLPWDVVAVALVAQSLLDLVASTAREWIGRAMAPSMHVRVLAVIFILDVCLTPVAVLGAARGVLDPAAVVSAVALLAFLAAMAADRRARIEQLSERLDELEGERRRRDAAVRAIADAYGARLDRVRLGTVALRAATEALGADRGRLTLAGRAMQSGEPAEDDALAAAERSASREGRPATAAVAGRFAVAHPLSVAVAAGGSADVVALSRAGAAFADSEQRLFGHLVGQLAVAIDNVALHERVSREARTDELTGLPNHRAFQEALATELERTRRFRRPLAVAMVDIDAFKAVNDTYGHQQGDEVLRHVATAIRETCRATDTPARYGGEELAVVLPETGIDGAYVVGENIRRAVEGLRLPLSDSATLRVTVSVGVAATGSERVEPAALIAAADAALYAAKRGGRNQTVRSAEPVVPAATAPGNAGVIPPRPSDG